MGKIIKKTIYLLFVMIILLLIAEFAVYFIKTNHDIKYDVKSGNKTFEVNEKYIKEKGNDYYYISVENDGIKYYFKQDNIFDKQRNIVNKINIYENEDDNITCMNLEYVKKNEKSVPLCYQNEFISYAMVKDKYNLDKEFDIKSIEKDEETAKVNDYTVYTKNLLDNESIVLYKYNKMLRIDKTLDENKYNLSVKDYKENKYGTLIDNFYFQIEPLEKKEYYSGYYIINLDTDMYTNYMFEFNLSLDTYINGVHDNYVYLFDKNALAQYRVDVKKQFTEMVCNEDKNNTCIVYENGEEKKKNIYDFKDEEIYFTDDSKEYKDINYEFLKRFNNNTVIYYDGENIYKVYNDDLDNKIKLYTIKDAKTIRIHKNYIYFIVDNTIYRFDEQNGAVKLVEFKDFKTNYNNIYDIYIKESK